MRSVLGKLKENKEALGTLNFGANNADFKKMETPINIQFSFEELLKLRLALDSAALELNKYNKAQIRKESIGINFFMSVQKSVKGEKSGRMTVTISKY